MQLLLCEFDESAKDELAKTYDLGQINEVMEGKLMPDPQPW